MKNLPNLSLVALAALSILSGCTGLSTNLGSVAKHQELDIKVTPITPYLIGNIKTSPKPQDPISFSQFKLGLELTAAQDRNYAYRVQPGDILDVYLPSLAAAGRTGPTPIAATPSDADRGYTIDPDGTIFLPHIGEIQAGGLSTQQIQRSVTKQMSRFLRTPQVTVSVKQFRSQKILLTGKVPEPGFLPITDIPLTVIGALTSAGAVNPAERTTAVKSLSASAQRDEFLPADLSRVRLTRDSKHYTVDVQSMLESSTFENDWLLRDGDVIHVPKLRTGYVFMMGEVKNQSLMQIAPGQSTLGEVLAVSGGLNQRTSNPERIYVIRGELPHAAEVYQLNADAVESFLLASAFPLEQSDIVYVSEAGISRWNRFLSQLLPSIQSVITGVVLSDAIDRAND